AAATAIMSISLMASAEADLFLRVVIGVSTYALAAFALNVAGIRNLADSGLLRLAARNLPFAERSHAR
ncbi:MAG TPA: hypothetical protein VFO00_10800, partial [Vitreimonas sp.]|nr:hypothetical protein [Vitreimonas sp.]